MLSWLYGSDEPKVIKADPLQQFPTPEDAAFARKNGAFYGTAMDPFANGLSAMFLSDADGPASGEGASLGDLTDPRFSQRYAPADAPNGRYTADTYARSALAANRSALASLGMDPRKFAMDSALDADKVNIGGAYSPETDSGFVIPGPSADAASTLTHESIHRGLQKLRDSGAMPVFMEGKPEPKTGEEAIVRLIMQKYMGDPEQAPEAVKLKSAAYDNFLGADGAMQNYVDNYLGQLESAAAQQIARNKPGGPR